MPKSSEDTQTTTTTAADAPNLMMASDSSNGSFVHIPDSHSTRTVAVVGGGVSGLAAAWHLQQQQNVAVHLIEAEPRLGGHAWTVECKTDDGDTVPVDIGFMVCNHLNYPNLVQWFQALSSESSAGGDGVQLEQSDMSLAVSLDCGVEWSSDTLFAHRPQQAVSPAFASFLYDMWRFNHNASAILEYPENDPRKHVTVGEFLQSNNYGEAFQVYYLLPMMAALWSASLEDVLEFPAVQLVSFLQNHCMLQIWERPQWMTVYGRSIQYVRAVQQILQDDSSESSNSDVSSAVHLNTRIHSIARTESGKYRLLVKTEDDDGGDAVAVQDATGTLYDDVVFACHSDTALQILRNSGTHLRHHAAVDALADIRYADNTIYVHSDPTLMPRKAWASWNCMGNSNELRRNIGKGKQQKGAFEGAESGFGNTLDGRNNDNISKGGSSCSDLPLEGAQGRFKAVYVT